MTPEAVPRATARASAHPPAATGALGAAPAIDVTGLRKRYRTTLAVRDASFTVGRGEILAILGPNGSGKTTTVECLQGLRRADAGTVRVLGLDPRTDLAALRRRIGCQLQDAALPERLRVGAAIRWFAAVGGRAGALLPTARAAQGAGVLLWFVLLILGGAGPPPEVLPGAMGAVGSAAPLRPVVLALQGPWFAGGWDLAALGVLVGLGAVSWGVAAARLRRE